MKKPAKDILAAIEQHITDNPKSYPYIKGPIKALSFTDHDLCTEQLLISITVKYATSTGRWRERIIYIKPIFDPFTGEKLQETI